MALSLYIGRLSDDVEIERLHKDKDYTDLVLFGQDDNRMPLGCWGAVILLLTLKATYLIKQVYVQLAVAVIAVTVFLGLMLFRRKDVTPIEPKMTDIYRIDDSNELFKEHVMTRFGTPIGPEDAENGQTLLLSKEDVKAFSDFINTSDISDSADIIEFLTEAAEKKEHVVLFVV